MSNARNGHNQFYYESRVPVWLRAAWKLHTIELYPNADAVGVKFNWWHPLAWILTVVFVVLSFFLFGLEGIVDDWKNSKFYYLPEPYFRDNPEQLEYLSRYKDKF